MEQFLTIQAFSERVGIAKSAIRYYESEGLLGAVKRNASGYRLYEEGQVEIVRLIASLRMADIAITDIKRYVNEASEIERQQMMSEWIRTIKMNRTY
ncbi:MerR family transcriptional regulator [Sporosarcina oncorhynchi]|uniref:MerR family transcriptional regulator n=1 Tax=Sporosarcina oncorhynchi TaxID=3056444 RepID=A0ABZ0L463_9BACL|nr:MerR family transcriptional regulator [Sporosarcina sp. T2O-4]WOV87382.1 MerR family transcriptional regulator [Sporosarcina sp. T2O-4]